MTYSWSDSLKFGFYDEKGELLFSGYVDEKKINLVTLDLIEEIRDVLRTMGEDPTYEKELLKQRVSRADLPNFIFIRAIFDYGNIAPSTVFADVMLKIYEEHPFLFKPNDVVWNDLLSLPVERLRRLLLVPLLRLRGLLRLSFESMAEHWANIVGFLRDICDGNASYFFERLTAHLGIDCNDDYALENLQLLLERKDVKKKLNMNFPYGKKNGRLLLTLMTENERGFGVLRGVKKAHLKNFNIPVNSQIIRVSINLGLIRITEVRAENIAFRKKGGRGLVIMREDFTEPCQKAWRMVASRLDILPVDLDYYIWSCGSLFCKQFGGLCYICPLRKICDSWQRGSVRESNAEDWDRGCFSFARPEPGMNRLILRTCMYCPDLRTDVTMNKVCVRGKRYRVRREDEGIARKILGTS